MKNNQEDFENAMFLNMGQLLSIPFIIAGIWFTWKGLLEKKKTERR
jgi:prolipoprotein diacylglyceryltransferase